jgi:hypothetical protein
MSSTTISPKLSVLKSPGLTFRTSKHQSSDSSYRSQACYSARYLTVADYQKLDTDEI